MSPNHWCFLIWKQGFCWCVVVQLPNRVWLCESMGCSTPGSLSFTISWSCSNSCPFVDVVTKNEVLLEQSELYIQLLDFYIKIDSDTEETGGRMPCKGRGRDWSSAATSKGMLGIARGGEEKTFQKFLGGAWPWWHLNSRLSASRTWREDISIVLSHPVWGN